MNPQEFSAKWHHADFKERSFYQTRFNDLCALVGHPDPVQYGDKNIFSFEAAYDQLLRYRESLQNPPLFIVSDAGLIRIHTNFTNIIKREYDTTLDDLLIPAKLDILKAAFHNPQPPKS